VSIWDLLFESRTATRRELNQLRAEMVSHAVPADVGERVVAVTTRLDRVELVVDALVEVLRAKGILSPEELAVAVQRVDLADGVEDGRMGPDRAAMAPMCLSCARPVNPARERCVYCDAPIDVSRLSRTTPPPRMARCGRCREQVPERDTYLTGAGLVCDPCYHGTGRAPAGSLSLASGGELSLDEGAQEPAAKR